MAGAVKARFSDRERSVPAVGHRITAPTLRTDAGGAATLLSLQRAAGNHAVQRWLKSKTPDASVTALEPLLPQLRELAADHALIRQLMVQYGVGDAGIKGLAGAAGSAAWQQTQGGRRALRNVAPAFEGQVRALREAHNFANGRGAATLPNLARNKKELQLLQLAFTVGQQADGLLRDLPPGYVHKRLAGGTLVDHTATRSGNLPFADVLAGAVGPLGEQMRTLAAPAHNGQPVAAGEVDSLYAAMFRHDWIYVPSGAPKPQALLLGHARAAVCGAFASAFLEAINIVAQARNVANPAHLNSRATPFVTISYGNDFIDSASRGNIGRIERRDGTVVDGYDGVRRAFFSSHTWVEMGGRLYDPLGGRPGVDFADAIIGDLTDAGPGPVRAANAAWEVVRRSDTPPSSFSEAYTLRER